MSFGPNTGYRVPWAGASATASQTSKRYPNPFFDVAQQRLPTQGIKQLFDACLYAMVADPLVSAAASKMATYPITPIRLTGVDGGNIPTSIKRKWEEVLHDNLQMEMFQIEIGLDYYGYGNSIVSLRVPFKKFLKCKACEAEFDLTALKARKDWTFNKYRFSLICPKCRHTSEPHVEDRYIRSARNTRLKRWNVRDIDITYYPMSSEYVYRYNIPNSYKSLLNSGDVKAIASTPVEMLEALRKGISFKLENSNLFHFKPPSIVVDDTQMGWGFPPILPTLKDGYYIQLMKKAQEAILHDHVVPMRWLSPAGTGSIDVYRTVNLAQWKKEVESQIRKWRGDVNHIPIFPLPLQMQQFGGQGKALLLVQEIQELSKQRLAGMGVPQEMVFGGLRWSSSSVSLKMLENILMTYRLQHHRMLNSFIIPMLSRVLGLPLVRAEMSPFKMGDDVQAKQILMNLSSNGKISDETLLGEMDLSFREEQERINKENRVKAAVLLNQKMEEAHISGEMGMLQTMYQKKTQAYLEDSARGEQSPQEAIQQPEATNVTQLPTSQKGEAQGRLAETQQDMRPLPEDRPPRRQGGMGVT
tara:strand:+ start:4643 stop:6397 length:1755 start_codon:yes stop_codon:yes gene_type:complete